MSTSCSLDKDEGGKPVEESKYRGMIKYLLYLTASCPNIMFVVSLCVYFQANSEESYLTAENAL